MAKRMKHALKRTGNNVKTIASRLVDKFFNNPVTDGSEPTETSIVEKQHRSDRGRFSNMPIADFQHFMFACSANGDMLTDIEMSEICTREFPRSKCVVNHGVFPVTHFTNMRTQYNSGTHSGQTKRPDKPVWKCIVDASGKRVIDPTWSKRYDPETGNKRVVK